MSDTPRPTPEHLAAIRRAYADARKRDGVVWMAASRVGDLLAEVDALTAENAALRRQLADAKSSGKAATR